MASQATPGESWLHEQLGRKYRLALLVVMAALLALTASFGVAWAAGLGRVGHALVHPNWYWLLIALAGEAVAYLGYTLAYRETVQAEGGAELEIPKTAVLVATGFGVFVQAGGFALDRAALERAGLSERESRARVLGLGALEYLVLAPATAVAVFFYRVINLWAPLLPAVAGLPTLRQLERRRPRPAQARGR